MFEEEEPFIVTEEMLRQKQGEGSIKGIITAYQVYLNSMYILGALFIGIWRKEMPAGFNWAHIAGLPLLLPIIAFFPAGMVGIRCRIKGAGPFMANVIWAGLEFWFIWYWFVEKTHSFFTLAYLTVMLLLGLFWVFFIQFHEKFREYILAFSGPSWLEPSYPDTAAGRRIRKLCGAAFLAAAAFSIAIR